MPTPPPEPSTDFRGPLEWLAAIFGVAAASYLAKALRWPRPKSLNGNGPADLKDIQAAIQELRKLGAARDAKIAALQVTIDDHFTIFPSHAKRIAELEADSEERRRSHESIVERLDDLTRLMRAHRNEILNKLAEMSSGSGGS